MNTLSPPIHRATTITSSNMEDFRTESRYGRDGTPTTDLLINRLSNLYKAHGCVLTPSGMTSITAALMSVLKSKDHILIPDCILESARRYIEQEFPRLQIEFTFYNPRNLKKLETLIKRNTKAIYVESPGTYTFEITDIKKVIDICKKRNVKSIVDNTWATALYLNPFKFGADIVIEAISKYASGHSDVLMGVTLANKKYLTELQRWCRNCGICVSSDDAYLVLRGLDTLSMRLKKSSDNSIEVANFLETKEEVKQVIHPALENHPDYQVWKKDFKGASGVFAMEFKDNISKEAINELVNNCKIFKIGTSWGGHHSLLATTDISKSRKLNSSYVPSGQYLRIYTGTEDIESLLNDLDFAFKRMRQYILSRVGDLYFFF
jgi:cystathionine beta-lyase|tara:strand:+ start:5130 stop:6263 length:1134 start_codon:yes stop_codon:yes gene_type:complete